MMRWVLMVGVIGATSVNGLCNDPSDPDVNVQRSGQFFTGNARVDLFSQTVHAQAPSSPAMQTTPANVPYKSPWVAAGLSLVLPGAGEIYSESYWKAAAFLAVEIAAWSIAYSNDRSGDRQTASFQAFAQEHWSAYKYARWTLDNASSIRSGFPVGEYSDVLNQDGSVNWTRLNQLERALGSWYSHVLPPFGDQQYYELIGKYQQFYHGWDDAESGRTTYEQISEYLNSHPDSRFQFYSRERGKANDYYNTASTFVTIAVVNHILSALDAAWSASSFNKFHAQMGVQNVPLGNATALVPVAKLSYSF